MKKKGEEQRDVASRGGMKARKAVTFCIMECPRGNICKNGGIFAFEKGTGFSKPFNHLKSCLASGDIDKLKEIYNMTMKENRASHPSIDSYFLLDLVSLRKKKLFTYLFD